MNALLEAHLAFRKNVAPGVKLYGLNPGNHRILLYVSEHPGCLQKDIAEHCIVETSTLSSVLKNLEKKGLLERRRFEKDNRAYAIYPTEKGQKIVDTVTEKMLASTKIALTGFSEKEAEDLMVYLDRVTENLKNANRLSAQDDKVS
ncbi:MAG: MarR family transcriptional regulator [Lachnospiraceae bacterium]|nr:MarR family transcriptional regulator [Lachnospiraceae bacterium]